MKMTNTRRAALTMALGLLMAGAAVAQSAVAHIAGSGKAGDTVLIENVDTGFHREITIPASGHYQQRNLPVGTFSVIVKHADGTTEAPKLVSLRVGVTARIK